MSAVFLDTGVVGMFSVSFWQLLGPLWFHLGSRLGYENEGGFLMPGWLATGTPRSPGALPVDSRQSLETVNQTSDCRRVAAITS